MVQRKRTPLKQRLPKNTKKKRVVSKFYVSFSLWCLIYYNYNYYSLVITFFIEKNQDNENEKTENASLPRSEVIKRLRERGHPILLFGENELHSFKRLRRIEIQEPEANRVKLNLLKTILHIFLIMVCNYVYRGN